MCIEVLVHILIYIPLEFHDSMSYLSNLIKMKMMMQYAIGVFLIRFKKKLFNGKMTPFNKY